MISLRIANLTSLRGLLLLLVILPAIGKRSSGQGLQPEKPDSNTIRGAVINAVTQSPIPRALVLTPDNRAGVLTDGEGHFEITLPTQSASQGIFFSSNGFGSSLPRQYMRHGQSFAVAARKPGFLDDAGYATPSSGDDLTIALMPEGIIKGRITLASGDPALGINVQLYSRQVRDGLPRWTQGPTTRANSAGEFRFAELHPGSYKLVTRELMDNDPITNVPGSQQYGFPPVYYPGASDFSAASTIELTAGQEVEVALSLARQPYYPVRIPIANGAINGGMNVSVQGQSGPGYALGYNAGEQRIEGLLPNGSYVVEGSTFGQNSVEGSESIRVTGAPVDGPALTLVPSSSIKLDVREEFTDTNQSNSGTWSDGKSTFALHGARLYLNASVESTDDLARRQIGQIRPPTAPNDDNLVIENLLPGPYWLRLHTARGYIASATQGPVDVLRHPVTVGSGPAAPIEVRVRDDSAELDGTVTDLAQRSTLSSESVEPMHVWIYCIPLSDSPGEFMEFGGSSDGKFTSTRMAPGDYRVLAFSRPQRQLPYRDPEAMKAYESKGPVAHLAAGQKATVEVQTISSE